MAKRIVCLLTVLFIGLAGVMIPEKEVYGKDNEGNLVIAIDAGHGSVDGGATQNGIKESELNWELATQVKAELQTYWGIEAYLTRGSSEWQSNAGRGRTGLSVDADFTISIHNNSNTDSASTGVETYYTLNPSYTQFTKSVATDICANISSVLGIKNRGAKTRQSSQGGYRDYYTFIDEATRAGIPSVLVECCYINNPTEAAKIAKPENQKKVATAIATALAKNFGLTKRGVADGSTMTLTRTYSATFVSSMVGGTFSSTNTAVAKVDANGIITAVGAGEADITYTGADGTVETVHIKVPQVQMVALAAGISPTSYYPTVNYDAKNIIVKALYSDGTAKQITGYTVGKLNAVSDGVYDIPISYNGLTTNLRVYLYKSSSNSTLGQSFKPGTNTDILRLPQLFQSINTGIKVTLTPTYSTFVPGEPYVDNSGNVTPPTPTEPPTVPPTEPPTTEPPTTEAPTTEAPTIEDVTPQETAPVVVEPQESSDNITTVDDSDDEAKNNNNWFKVGIIASGALVICAAAACIVVLIIKARK